MIEVLLVCIHSCNFPCFKASLYPPKEQQDDQNQKDQPESAAGIVSPVPAVGPGGKNANQHEDQDDKQYGSHDFSPFSSETCPSFFVTFMFVVLCPVNTGVFVRLARGGLAHLACPNVFPSPISSSSFARLRGVSARVQAIDDDDSPVAALSIHGGCSQGLRSATTPDSFGICTSALHKDATSSLDKTEPSTSLSGTM